MKVLIIDRDTMFSNLMASKIRAAGHEVIETGIKNEGIEQIGTNHVDAVFVDPSPLSDCRSIVLQIKRAVHSYPYIIQTGVEINRQTAINAGCHDALSKPLDPTLLSKCLENAARMTDIVRRLGDASYDFPSAGGVISKSAFNQLFLSSVDRASRYGEVSQALFIRIANYEDLVLDEGKAGADYVVSKLAHTLARLRRQSDILGQTGNNEYALLVLHSQAANEAMEAAKRFADSLEKTTDLSPNGLSAVSLEISLVELPTGERTFHHARTIESPIARSAG